jgi:hypothetical protein
MLSPLYVLSVHHTIDMMYIVVWISLTSCLLLMCYSSVDYLLICPWIKVVRCLIIPIATCIIVISCNNYSLPLIPVY